MWHPQVLGNLIEDWVLLLLLLPVSDISCGQPCGSSHYRLFLDCLLTIQNGSDSLLCMLFEWHDSIVEYGLDPRVWNLVQVFPNFLLREAFIHLAQEVSHSVVFTLLVLQGEVVASESSYPPLPCSIQIGRGEDVSEQVVVSADYKLIPVLPIWGQIFMELLCNGPLKGQEFLFVGVVPLFSLIHHMAGIGDRMVSFICLLMRQNSPKASSRGISFQQERLVEVWKGQNRSLEAGGLETLEGFPCLRGQVDVFRLLVLQFWQSPL